MVSSSSPTSSSKIASDRTQNVSPSSPNGRKLFVGGLHWSTTEATLKEYMNQYGKTDYVKIVYDNFTGRSRGFGFIKFTDDSSIEKVINSGPHTLDDKKIDPKLALPISSDPALDDQTQDLNQPPCRKIFVGGLKHDQSDQVISEYFKKFGTITDIKFYYQKNSNLRRGFCFVEYDDPECAQKALENRYHTINNETVEVKVAQRRNMKYNTGKNYKLNGNGVNYASNLIPYYDIPSYYYMDQTNGSIYNNGYYIMPYYCGYPIPPQLPAATVAPFQALPPNELMINQGERHSINNSQNSSFNGIRGSPSLREKSVNFANA